MKPEWKDAPEWAKWLAMDADGTWFWFEVKPILTFAGFLPCDVNYGPKKRKQAGRTHFSETLEKKP